MPQLSPTTRYVDIIAVRLAHGESPSEIRLSVRVDAGRIVSEKPICGWQYASDVSRPFVIDLEGRLDFGTLYDLHQYGETNLLAIEIAIGSNFSWLCHGSDEAYQILQIKPIREAREGIDGC